MCNKNTSKVLLRTIVAFVLAAVMISALFLPILKVGTYDVQTSEEYTSGLFTQYAKPVGEIDVNLFTFVDIGLNIRDIYDVIRIQSIEAKITYMTNEALSLYYEMSSLDDDDPEKAELKAEIDAIMADANELNTEIESISENMGEERQIEIAEKLQDKDFCESLILSYLVYNNFSDTFIEVDTSTEKAAFATNVAGILEILLILVIFVYIVYFIIAFAILFVVKLICFIVKLIAKKCDDESCKKLSKFPLVSCALTFFTLFLLWSIVSSMEIAIGTGLIVMLVVAVVSALSNAIFRALLANKNIVDTLLNVTVCVVAIFLAIFLSLTLLKVDALYDYKKSADEYTYVYFLEAVSENNIETIDEMNLVLEEVAKANIKNTVIILTVSVGIAILLVCAISYFIKQLSNDGEIRAEGKPMVSRAGIVLCSVLLAVSLVPSLIGTASVDKQYESIEKGRYKILWHAYVQQNTTMSQEYNTCLTTYTSLVHEIEALGEKIEIAEGDTLLEYKQEREDVVDYTWMVGRKLNRTRIDKKNGASMCMAAAVALFVTQFVYTFIMYDNKKKRPVVVEGEAIDSEAVESEAIESAVDEAEVIESEIVEAEAVVSEVVEAEVNEPEESPEDQKPINE